MCRVPTGFWHSFAVIHMHCTVLESETNWTHLEVTLWFLYCLIYYLVAYSVMSFCLATLETKGGGYINSEKKRKLLLAFLKIT